MSKRAPSRSDSLVANLREIYGADAADEIVAGIRERVAKYSASVKRGVGELTERDVLLITYGDTFNEAGTPPLQVLHRFYREYLADVFALVHILPFHPYSSDDGFSVIDYYAVREDLGDWEDIADLSADCRIMADAVINHMSSESHWFHAFLDNDPEFDGFFFECDPDTDLSGVVRPRTTPLLTPFKDASGKVRHVWTTFSADQVDLNFLNPKVLVQVIDVLFFLVSRGASLLRLDAITFLWKEPGTPSANMRQTHLLIKIMRTALEMLDDEVVAITETNVPHRENVAYFGNGHDEAHMVYNFALPPLLAHSFIAGNSTRLREWASRLELPGDEVSFLNFSASHDGVGVRPVEEILDSGELQGLVGAAKAANGRVSSRTMPDGQEKPYELNCTFLDLISKPDDDMDTRVQRFVASQSVVLAMPGVPAVYVQSLLGTRNDLELLAETGRARSINRSRHDYAAITAKLDDEKTLQAQVFSRLCGLIRERRQHAAFGPYKAFEVLDFGELVFAIRRDKGPGAVCCITNLVNDETSIEISADDAGVDLLTGDRIEPGVHRLGPYAVRWLVSA